jgi:FAD/FMN-containing dehydrogenase
VRILGSQVRAAGLLSWGNYPPFPQTPVDCSWREDAGSRFEQLRQVAGGGILPFGSGMSYGDSCLAASDHVLRLRQLDRFIHADWTTGVLAAEAGTTLEEILAVCIPKGWFLPVTPGTRYATLGGAIANDVHGKNHHRRGTFGRHLRRFGLLRSDVGRSVCSATEQPELFRATIGGLGLSGIVEWAEIQLIPIRAAQVVGVSQRFGNLGEFFALSDELDANHEFCVSWVDCLARGREVGRGVYSAGSFAAEGTLAVDAGRPINFPLTPPLSLVGRASLRAFNEFYWRKAPRGRTRTRSGYARFFYPLDAIRNWNRMYGVRGFQQYQCVIPEASAEPGIRALLQAVAASGSGSFLAVLKRCGDIPSPGLLSFPMAGTTLALDFPQRDDLEATLFPRLDAIVREAGGRLYPAKDAHMRGDDFRRSYPAWSEVEKLRDPALLSRFWHRVMQ